MSETLKAPPRPCRFCGTEIPEQPSSPGRPRAFCSRKCSRRWHGLKEHYEREREKEQGVERGQHEWEKRLHGEKRADSLARKRQKEIAAREKAREAFLERPWEKGQPR
jgi:endogenous inhibitor of DNA gyrase (YacG/DUF329 family)